MRLSVPGPVSVSAPDGPVAIEAPKQRLLLAHLISRADRPVTLIEPLWGGSSGRGTTTRPRCGSPIPTAIRSPGPRP